ncbi:hypothetical protein N2152v2_001517 [Parachlorella kessleri]
MALGGMLQTISIIHLLAFCGFAILLGGVSSVQEKCGSVPETPVGSMVQYASMGYLPGQVSCDKFFRYTWWITFFHFFVWFLVLAFLFTRTIHKFRAGLVGLLAAVTVLLMDTANTYLYFEDVPSPGGDSTFRDRAKVVFAGALIAAVADALLLVAIGWHDEKATWEERTGTSAVKGYDYGAATVGTTPMATNVQTTTVAAAVGAVVRLDNLSLPAGFHIEVYATVPGARSIAVSPNSTKYDIIYVGSMTDAQKVYAVVGEKGKGNGTVVELTPSLNKPNGVAWHNGALYIAEINRILRYDNADSYAVAGKPFGQPVVVSTNLPEQADHGFGPDGRLYVPIGAPTDDGGCDAWKNLRYCTLTSMKADGSDHTVYATGIRAMFGMDFDPSSKDLYFTINERNKLGNSVPDDTLDAAPRPGLDFGFPRCYTEGEGNELLRSAGPGKLVPAKEANSSATCDGVTPAVQALGPHTAPLGMSFYMGSMFPAQYKGTVFIAQHGSYVRTTGTPLTGYNLVNVKLDGSGKGVAYNEFAKGWAPADNKLSSMWGRPVDVQPLSDGSLVVSDDLSNTIYRIYYNASG